MSLLSERIDLLLTGGSATEGAKVALNEIQNMQKEEFSESIKDILSLRDLYEHQIHETDNNIKSWQDAKKTWQEIKNTLDSLIIDSLNHFNLKSAEQDGYKATITKRNVLEIDEEFLLNPYENEKRIFKETLPEYIDVKLSINKTKLNKYVQEAPQMLEKNPEKLHWTENKNLKVTFPSH